MKMKQYLRDSVTRQPYGVLLAELRENGVHFGWSVTHPSDTYNKSKGEMIAQNRLNAFVPNSTMVLPTCLIDTMNYFLDRAERYYKQEISVTILDGWVEAQKKAE